MMALAAASYSNTLGVGTAIDSLPLDSISKLEGLWLSDGEGDYRIDEEEEKDGGACGLGRLCARLAEGIDVRTDWAAASVTQANNKKVAVASVNGLVVEADVVIVAVPVAVLQKLEAQRGQPFHFIIKARC